MSAGSLAYQLRPNKAVDRNLFIDLLNKLNRFVNISDYTYYGFGGPFLEDFKLMHAHLRIGNMVSIESDKEVHLRQQFNSPLSCVSFINRTSGDFIESNDFNCPSVVWLDYTDPSQLGIQLSEIEYLITKLGNHDIVKLTLNCNPSTLGGEATDEKELQEVRLDILESRLNDYFPSGTESWMMRRVHYGKVIFKAVEIAIQRGMKGKQKSYFQVLSGFIYQDGGHPMLTVTGIILEDEQPKIDEFFESTRVRNWPSGLFEWNEPKLINVPELSVKERIHIDNLLPQSDTASIKASLGYLIDGDDAYMTSLIQNYIDYYRMYPLFSRVVL